MIIDEVKYLLDLFYEGRSTKEEEEKLKKFFQSEDVPDELKVDKEVFLGFFDSDVEPPASLSADLEKLIDREEKQENKAKNIKLYIPLLSVAASIALIVACGVWFMKSSPMSEKPIVENGTHLVASDSVKLMQAEKALSLVSSKLNKGLAKASKVDDQLNKTNEILNRIKQ